MEPLSADEFNHLTNHLYAEDEDICYRIGDTMCVCNTGGDVNNIGIENIGKPSVKTLANALRFLLMIYREYDIDYISIREEVQWPAIRRYRYLRDADGVIYIRLSDNLKQLEREVDYEIRKRDL